MERKKTQATTAKLKKVQTEIKKTKDKLNKLMAEEERLTVQYQTESYEETLAYLKSASKNGKPDLEEMWKFLQSTYSPELKNSVSPSTGNSAPSEESTDDVEENSETEETSSTVPESKNYHFNVSNPELISKIERFNEYGFANRTDFFLEAIKAYDTIFTPENSLKKLITDAVMDGIVGALNIETNTTDDGDKTNFEDSDEDYLIYIK